MPRRTPAELAREKKLRDDPMAEVHGPLFVTCKRCGNRIKLSPKSSYDPFHWTKHRERCLRKPLGLPRPVRRVPKDAVSGISARGRHWLHADTFPCSILSLAHPPGFQKISAVVFEYGRR